MNNDQLTHPDHHAASAAAAPGVLPDDVIRDPRSDAVLLHITLRPDATLAELEQFNRGYDRSSLGARARQIVHNSGGGEVVTHGRDGRIRDSDTVAPGHDPFPPRDQR